FAIASTRATKWSTSACGPSSSTMRSASTSSGQPACTNSSTAWIAGLSIISMPPGMIPAPMILPTHSPASSELAKPISAARAMWGLRQDPPGPPVDAAEHPPGAGDDAEQVIAAGLGMFAAQPDDLARHQHDL